MSSMRMNQFYKTKMCPWYFKGRCERGSTCRFAHFQGELRTLPNLSKTSLCPQLLKLGQCTDPEYCRFAHTVAELRATDDLYKTSLCFLWMRGRCDAGDQCRHAHGVGELRSLPKASSTQQLKAVDASPVAASTSSKTATGHAGHGMSPFASNETINANDNAPQRGLYTSSDNPSNMGSRGGSKGETTRKPLQGSEGKAASHAGGPASGTWRSKSAASRRTADTRGSISTRQSDYISEDVCESPPVQSYEQSMPEGDANTEALLSAIAQLCDSSCDKSLQHALSEFPFQFPCITSNGKRANGAIPGRLASGDGSTEQHDGPLKRNSSAHYLKRGEREAEAGDSLRFKRGRSRSDFLAVGETQHIPPTNAPHTNSPAAAEFASPTFATSSQRRNTVPTVHIHSPSSAVSSNRRVLLSGNARHPSSPTPPTSMPFSAATHVSSEPADDRVSDSAFSTPQKYAHDSRGYMPGRSDIKRAVSAYPLTVKGSEKFHPGVIHSASCSKVESLRYRKSSPSAAMDGSKSTLQPPRCCFLRPPCAPLHSVASSNDAAERESAPFIQTAAERVNNDFDVYGKLLNEFDRMQGVNAAKASAISLQRTSPGNSDDYYSSASSAVASADSHSNVCSKMSAADSYSNVCSKMSAADSYSNVCSKMHAADSRQIRSLTCSTDSSKSFAQSPSNGIKDTGNCLWNLNGGGFDDPGRPGLEDPSDLPLVHASQPACSQGVGDLLDHSSLQTLLQDSANSEAETNTLLMLASSLAAASINTPQGASDHPQLHSLHRSADLEQSSFALPIGQDYCSYSTYPSSAPFTPYPFAAHFLESIGNESTCRPTCPITTPTNASYCPAAPVQPSSSLAFCDAHESFCADVPKVPYRSETTHSNFLRLMDLHDERQAAGSSTPNRFEDRRLLTKHLNDLSYLHHFTPHFNELDPDIAHDDPSDINESSNATWPDSSLCSYRKRGIADLPKCEAQSDGSTGEGYVNSFLLGKDNEGLGSIMQYLQHGKAKRDNFLYRPDTASTAAADGHTYVDPHSTYSVGGSFQADAVAAADCIQLDTTHC